MEDRFNGGIYFTSKAGFLIFSNVKHEWKYEEQNHVSGVKKINFLFNDKTIEFSVCYNFVGCEQFFFRKVQTLHGMHDFKDFCFFHIYTVWK